MGLYREQGIVLRTHKLGETDRIVTVLTQGRGKVRAVAKGVRKPGSRFGGRLEPLGHVDLQLYEGRNLDIVNQAELITHFARLREDWASSACAWTMAEAVDRVAQEERATSLFLLLLDGLRMLAAAPTHPSLVLDAYLLRLASLAGYHAHLDACAGCGTPGHHAVFHLEAGGALCPACAPSDTRPLSDGVLKVLHALAASDWGEDATDAEPSDRRLAGTLVSSYLTHHLGRPLTSWELVPR
ncbi:DNA repair protein RecO [Egibacter rhizosphaerae]|uniref:DNA repair protein RecO n=1 Tax=Egibacter rhizosphaerae TaxID=1670831 RepID=A0A411YBP3_9ACTN|nr:DNA repair protein RecO [Egibacter rhizosphaerae]QBI18620.1 DNA repair protein RecO [Egibacter rhizosphaerae]